MRITIIGGGPAGYEAALVGAAHGAEVTLVCDERVGGNSVLWDCVPSKAMIVSGEAMGWVASARRLGVRSADGGDLAAASRIDLAGVMDRVSALGGDQSTDIAENLSRAGVRMVPGRGWLEGPGTVAIDPAEGAAEKLDTDICLLATGSKPRILPFFEPDGERVFTSRELFSLRELPRRLIVVGGGATGAEYAQAFARFGSDVHLISSRSLILPTEDTDAAAVIEDAFEETGMTIHREARAVDLHHTDDGVAVKIGDGSWIDGSHALFCIGQIPNSGSLGLADAGVDTDDRGAVTVDGVSRTSEHTVYAAGDVTGRLMLASTAAMQGRSAMWHALGQPVGPLRERSVAKCVFTQPEFATVGMTSGEVAESTTPIQTIKLDLAPNPRAKMDEHTKGFIKIHAMEGSGLVLGASVVGADASELIAPLALAVYARMLVGQLAHAFTVYPSMSGSVAEAGRQLMERLQREAA